MLARRCCQNNIGALFFGPAIPLWLIAIPEAAALADLAWLYLFGGLVALVMFAPSFSGMPNITGYPSSSRCGAGADRGFQAGLHRRIDPDALPL